ncbi:hypothetical protein BUALT_Bualt10G0077400 [Buddleja alternifolia]|uniref:Uncharacterized protein n=1 Tax=Buddleja alternifolia TaxID=168488 RepID=A0AAV6X443_9LAMI|nr:hypothetical protein BUALT_Bualt10G0077400 [Buddleja alternifolia]
MQLKFRWNMVLFSNLIKLARLYCGSSYKRLESYAVSSGHALAGQCDPNSGIGRANTSLVLISEKLFALEESDLPYGIKLMSDGDIISLGRHECFGEPFMTMTAHPKINMETDEAFAFRYSSWPPFLTNLHSSTTSPYRKTTSFSQTQIVFKPEDILRGALRFDQAKVPRLGMIPRHAVDEREMWWVDVPGSEIPKAGTSAVEIVNDFAKAVEIA